jgi:hypothetical protein
MWMRGAETAIPAGDDAGQGVSVLVADPSRSARTETVVREWVEGQLSLGGACRITGRPGPPRRPR